MRMDAKYCKGIHKSKLILTCLFLLASVLCIYSQKALSLPPIIDSGMILQKEDMVPIWGKSGKNSQVTIKAGWSDEVYITLSDDQGKWLIDLPTPKASFQKQNITISNKQEQVILEDVLIGDVWFVSGQSNMYESFQGFVNQPVNRAQEILLNHTDVDGLRLFKVKETNAIVESDSIHGTWEYSKTKNVLDFSAVGYVFGKTVFDFVDIPIGLIQCAQSGSLAEAWLDKKSLEEFGGFDLENIVIETKGLGNSKPTLQYNSMLHPLLPIRIKGVVWYQGEANVKDPKTYKDLFPFLINKWRDYFENPELPFYYVQIAPFSYDYAPGLESQYLREVQLNTMKKLRNVGMAVTLDIGSKDKIHPSEKETVGKRLAYWAINQTYGFESIACRGPEFSSMFIEEGRANLRFDYSPGGLTSFDQELTGFEISGEDKIFHKANAVITMEKGVWKGIVKVWSDKVTKPVAVRYGFENYIQGTLYNTQGLPASSFRTDDW